MGRSRSFASLSDNLSPGLFDDAFPLNLGSIFECRGERGAVVSWARLGVENVVEGVHRCTVVGQTTSDTSGSGVRMRSGVLQLVDRMVRCTYIVVSPDYNYVQ